MTNTQSFASLDEYLAHYARAAEIPTPVVDPRTGRVHRLNSLLHAPRREGLRARIRRMADLITRRVTFAGGITRDDLLAGGFSEDDLARLFPLALRRSGVVHLEAHL